MINEIRVNAFLRVMSVGLFSDGIPAEFDHHGDLRTKPRSHDCLIGALATEACLIAGGWERLAGSRECGCPGSLIEHRAPDHTDARTFIFHG